MISLKKLWETWCRRGLLWPYAFDPTTKQPSITLLMLYFATLVMFSAEITNLFLPTLLQSTLVTIFVWFLAFVMYRVRKIDKLKLDASSQSIELESSDEEQKEDNDRK